jgi:hypothetical protein
MVRLLCCRPSLVRLPYRPDIAAPVTWTTLPATSTPFSGPFQAPPLPDGGRTAAFIDPDGNNVAFAQPGRPGEG